LPQPFHRLRDARPIDPVSSLETLQEEFARSVLGGDLESFAARVAGGPAAAATRLAIYRRAVLHNLCGALAGAYPVVRRLVGEAFFDEAATRHAQAEPSRSGDLNRFGAGFAQFLARYPHAAALPYLPDVARLEWAWHESLAAAEAAGLDFAALARVDPALQPRIRFAVHPSVRVVHSRYPVLAIWEANQPGRDGTPEAGEGPDDILVHREDGRVRLARISAPEAQFLARLMRGQALEEAAEVEGDWHLPETLERWAAHGVLAAFSLRD
jgi:hypothetical protein